MIKDRLANNDKLFIFWAATATFSTYFCMYAFRKPFTAATFEGFKFFDITYKISLVIAQVLGYACSKFFGIVFISQLKSYQRINSILALMSFAWLTLLLFAVVPAPYNIFCMFLNGLPLGLIWGIVFSYLEGRKLTELLGACLATSFILASGVVKSIGLWLMNDYGVSPFNMPFFVGAIFALPMCVSVWMLSQIPNPTKEDIKLRSKRSPMTRAERLAVFNRFAFGIILVTVYYLFLTAFRDFRDNFIVDIWNGLGYAKNISVLTVTELPIAFGVLIIVANLVFVKKNSTALWLNHALIIFGTIGIGVSTLMFQYKFISPIFWMIWIGFSMYLCYILFQSLIFERMMATFREPGNVGFLMYVADAFGYLGSVVVLLFKNFGGAEISWLNFFIMFAYFISVVGVLLIAASWFYFYKKYSKFKSNSRFNAQHIIQ